MSEEQERALIQDSIDTIRKHTGQKLDGWLAPALDQHRAHDGPAGRDGPAPTSATCSTTTSPAPVKVASGRLVSIPYSLEMNDIIVYNVNLVYAPPLRRRSSGGSSTASTPRASESGTVMCIPLHPYLVGQPHRIEAFEEALRYITGHDEVWLATGREIARHFIDHYYDAFAAASHAPAGRSGRMILPDDYLRVPAPRATAWTTTATTGRSCRGGQTGGLAGGARVALWVTPALRVVPARHEGAAVQAAGRAATRLPRPAALHAARLRQPGRHLPHHEGARPARHPRPPSP